MTEKCPVVQTGLRNSETGLPFFVWLRARAGAQHDARIKCSPTSESDPKHDVVVGLRPELHIVSGTMSEATMAALAKFVVLNEQTIMALWNGKIADADVRQRIRMVSMRPPTIAEVARRRAARPDRPFWTSLREFLDEFYECDGAPEMLRAEPLSDIDLREAAYLAAATEYLSECYGFVSPAWAEQDRYFLAVPHYDGGVPAQAMKELLKAESPHSFRRRMIYTGSQPLRRKLGPNRKTSE